MDKFYDNNQAVKTLDAVIQKETDHADTCVYFMKPDTFISGGYSIVPQGNREYILARGTTSEEMGEATICIQGIISGSVLPPFPKGTSTMENRLKTLRQGITITGLHSTPFQTAVANLRILHAMFKRFTPEGTLEETADFLGSYVDANGDEHLSVTANNRFFTRTQYAQDVGIVPVRADIDPHGLFSKVDPQKFVHTEDNQVTYHLLTTAENGEWEFNDAQPIIFHVGDIVEIQVSMTCFPVNDKYKVKLILQSIGLINGSMTTNAFMARAAANIHVKEVQTTKLKRRQPYGRKTSLKKDKKEGETSSEPMEVERTIHIA
ncbi:hypothetical protein ONZ45_g5231 [Pleurotus djamor]|nr:hypothetical protein ONZ45_g5231 [Pleurotus djamor]